LLFVVEKVFVGGGRDDENGSLPVWTKLVLRLWLLLASATTATQYSAPQQQSLNQSSDASNRATTV